MNTAAGLSRRRVATSTSSVSGNDLPSSSRHANGSASNGTASTHAGSAFEGGKKIACDPRDLDQDREDNRSGKTPRLTIMEEVLLLGLKDKHVRSMAPLFATFRHLCELRRDFRSASARSSTSCFSCPWVDELERTAFVGPFSCFGSSD